MVHHLLDIKPYIPNFDKHDDDEIKIGWFEDKHHNAVDKKSDRRFLDKKTINIDLNNPLIN